jgi:Sulfotransferase domain
MAWQRLLAHVPPWADFLVPPDLDPRPKIVGIGFYKTGTTSLGRALRILGHRLQKGFTFNKPGKRVVIPEPVTFDKVRDAALPMMRYYSAFEDNPWPFLYRDVDRAYPGTRFILTYRDSESWYRSACGKWSRTGKPKVDKKEAIRQYEAHNAAVRTYFKDRQSDLLCWDLTQNPTWEPLCRFVGAPIPNRRFPHGKPGRFIAEPNPRLVSS